MPLIPGRHLAALVCICAWAAPALAWSTKEHILLTRIAAGRLTAHPETPPQMRQWLLKAIGDKPLDLAAERSYFLDQRVGAFARGADGLMFWAAYPDLAAMADKADRKIEPFGVNEQKLHFIDVEFFHPDAARRRFADDLSARPKLEDFPKNLSDERYERAGMLPFAVEHHYGLLVRAIRNGRLDDKPGQWPRDDHAARWAGCLAHYLQDNTQPHHSTEDYQSKSYFRKVAPDPRRSPNVHSDLEYRLVDDERQDYPELRQELWELFVKALDDFKDPIETDDPWRATLEVALLSYEALPMIGRAAVAAYPNAGPGGSGRWDAAAFFHAKGQYRGREMTVMQMKAEQLAWAVKRVERTWLKAWEEASGN
jgi:hypothetical protein